MLAILARKYDWEVDLTEPLKTFPLPYPAWGLPMTVKEVDSTVADMASTQHDIGTQAKAS